uniref:Uncharacterized protein n=1 Tax=Knipowitschia caucasica TaxID=637954 RepID=A0AAV2LDW1_KNICA
MSESQGAFVSPEATYGLRNPPAGWTSGWTTFSHFQPLVSFGSAVSGSSPQSRRSRSQSGLCYKVISAPGSTPGQCDARAQAYAHARGYPRATHRVNRHVSVKCFYELRERACVFQRQPGAVWSLRAQLPTGLT